MIYNCKPLTQEAEADRSLNSRPAWSPSRVLDQPELYSEILSQKVKQRWGQRGPHPLQEEGVIGF